MGSSTMENSTNDCINERCYKDVRSKRPDFFPCSACGRFFTTRAMLVHKRTCLENESCQCSVCKSESKKLNWESLKNKRKISPSYSTKHDRRKKKSKNKSRFRDILSGNMHSVKNGIDDHNKLLTFKLVEENSYIIDKMVAGNKSSSNSNSITNESSANNGYLSIPSEPFENSQTGLTDVAESSLDKSYESVELKNKFDHDCNRKLFCCFCNEHFFWESFGLHVTQHCKTINGFLYCPNVNCIRHFSQPALFLSHYLLHNSDHPLDCSECRCSNPICGSTNNVVNEHGYAESDPYHCYICLTHFSHPQSVINHMRLHSKEMPFKCTVCDRSFRQIGNLQRHLTAHRGERPYKCNECSSSFADPATLRNHERVHTGETPYVCNVCTRGFSQVGNLKRHMALHLKKDPSSTTFSSTIEMSSDENTIIINPPDEFKINLNAPSEANGNNNEQSASDYTNNNIESLCEVVSNRKTRRKKGKMKVFTCTICNKVYAWQHDLTVHFRTHTGEKPYKCELCGKQFAQSGAVRIHKDRHHSYVVSHSEQNS